MDTGGSIIIVLIITGCALLMIATIVLIILLSKRQAKYKEVLRDNQRLSHELSALKEKYSTDTVYAENDKFKLAEASLNIMEAKEIVEGKQKELVQLNKEISLQKEELEKQRDLNEEQKFRIADCTVNILEQKEHIEKQKEEIEKQRDLIKAQRDKIKLINEEITSSIQYASRIQKAILPKSNFDSEILRSCFILFRPKDIVSGDFYWFAQINERIIVVAADCTGHGVPGAFMSMLGTAFLNEIIIKENISEVNKILDQLREHVIRALDQKGIEGEQKDGMDIVLCSINEKTKTLSYAGANNPLYIVRSASSPGIPCKREHLYNDRILYEIKGDSMPIGIYLKMKNFEQQEIQLEHGDQLYLISDGYPDQFGGPEGKTGGKKFKYKVLKELILANSHHKLIKQKELLESTLDEWMSYPDSDGEPFEQVDDITVIGVKI